MVALKVPSYVHTPSGARGLLFWGWVQEMHREGYVRVGVPKSSGDALWHLEVKTRGTKRPLSPGSAAIAPCCFVSCKKGWGNGLSPSTPPQKQQGN